MSVVSVTTLTESVVDEELMKLEAEEQFRLETVQKRQRKTS
jgi:hypothetical protein